MAKKQQLTHWRCPQCKAVTHVPAYELATVGTPMCTDCAKGPPFEVEMEPYPEFVRKKCPVCGTRPITFPHPRPKFCSAECYLMDAAAVSAAEKADLKLFRVLITRDATESCHVPVAARDEAEAERAALTLALSSRAVLQWEVDEGNEHPPYIADTGNCASEVEDPA